MLKEQLEELQNDPKGFLNRPRMLENQIFLKTTELQKYQGLAVQITSAFKDVVVYTGPGFKIEDCAVAIADLEEEIKDTTAAFFRAVQAVKEAIGLIDDQKQREVLTARYVSRLSWTMISGYFGCTDRWVYRLHKASLGVLSEKAAEVLANLPAYEQSEMPYN